MGVLLLAHGTRFSLRMTRDYYGAHLVHEWRVQSSSWDVLLGVSGESEASEWGPVADQERTLAIELGRQPVPVVQTDLEHLGVIHFAHSKHVRQCLNEKGRSIRFVHRHMGMGEG